MQDVALLMPTEGDFHKFQYWFAEALKDSGAPILQDCNIPHKLRAAMGRYFGFSISKPKKRLIVLGCHRIESVAWPWCWRYEIVPFMWDLWPDNFIHFIRFLKRCRVRQCFVTASQNVERVKKCCPDVDVVWVPEGIKASEYSMGPSLSERGIDVLNYGRSVPLVTSSILDHKFKKPIKYVYNKGCGFVFPDFQSLTAGIRDSKMAVCYPQCDTNPDRCGDVETLTQRYWECMLSGTLMVGRAPKELINICGYNPVIELGDKPAVQIECILDNIGSYQALADRNRKTAEMRADWSNRIPTVMNTLARFE